MLGGTPLGRRRCGRDQILDCTATGAREPAKAGLGEAAEGRHRAYFAHYSCAPRSRDPKTAVAGRRPGFDARGKARRRSASTALIEFFSSRDRQCRDRPNRRKIGRVVRCRFRLCRRLALCAIEGSKSTSNYVMGAGVTRRVRRRGRFASGALSSLPLLLVCAPVASPNAAVAGTQRGPTGSRRARSRAVRVNQVTVTCSAEVRPTTCVLIPGTGTAAPATLHALDGAVGCPKNWEHDLHGCVRRPPRKRRRGARRCSRGPWPGDEVPAWRSIGLYSGWMFRCRDPAEATNVFLGYEGARVRVLAKLSGDGGFASKTGTVRACGSCERVRKWQGARGDSWAAITRVGASLRFALPPGTFQYGSPATRT
jgi:hypothetical protein